MSNFKIVSGNNAYQGYVLPNKYKTQGLGWVNTEDPRELAKIGTIIKKNGESHTIVEVKKFYHSPTDLAIRRAFATILCICTLGTAAFIKGVRNFFKNANIVYLADKTDSVNPLMKINVERLFPKDKNHNLKLKERAARKAEAAANPYRKPENPFKKMQVEKLVKTSKEDALKASQRAVRKAQAEAEEADSKDKDEINFPIGDFNEPSNFDKPILLKTSQTPSDEDMDEFDALNRAIQLFEDEVLARTLQENEEIIVLPNCPDVLFAEIVDQEAGHAIFHRNLCELNLEVKQETEENAINSEEQIDSNPFNSMMVVELVSDLNNKQAIDGPNSPNVPDAENANPEVVHQILSDLLNEQGAKEKAEQETKDAQLAQQLENQPNPDYIKYMEELLEQQRLRDIENRKKARQAASDNTIIDLGNQVQVNLPGDNLKIELVD